MSEQDPDQPTSHPASGRLLPLLLVLFVGSGCAALIYEIVWLQLLQLVIGSTAVSLGVLLGTFMGGMCLGSVALARIVSARRHPLRVYGLLELGIGIIGIAVLFGMPLVGQVYTTHVGHALPGIMLRGVVSGACLLPPTFLMGATLPAIARWVEATPKGVSWLGFFYSGNIAGAVFGCLLAGFYLLRVHDMATATYVAVSINVAVALIALSLAIRTPHCAPAVEPTQGSAVRASGSWAVYVTIALSGMSALGAEVVWTRLVSLILGGTVYTFSIILSVFLIGLGIGSSVGSFLARGTVSPRIALGVCQMLLAAAIAWTAHMISDSIPYWPIDPSISLSPWFTFQLDLARCMWAILPAACLWGASFPLALAAVASRGQDPGRLVGGVYAANTVGAIVGALAFSIVVISSVGTQWAQRLLIGLSAVAALMMLAPLLWPSRATVPSSNKSKRPALGIAVALTAAMGIGAWLVWSVSPAPWGMIAYGRYMATWVGQLVPGITEEKDVPFGDGTPDVYCTYVGEGMNVSVAVTMTTAGVQSFHGAGKVQASNDPQDMRLQRMLGHISALAHKNPESVLVVACGAGVTAGTFVLYPGIKRIVICDIEPLVPRFVAPKFKKENYGVVDDPRTQVILDDGRHLIRTTQEKFDIITSDPIDPWVKGCAALNTVEYYRWCKEHLNPGGVMSLWIPLYESNSDTAKSVIATFFKVFPNGIIWSNDIKGEGYDAVLFGQVEPTKIDVDELQARLDRNDYRRVKESLEEVGFGATTRNFGKEADGPGVVVDLLATYAGQAPHLQEWGRDAQINTDRNLRLQYLAGMWLNSFKGREILAGILRYYRFPENLFFGSGDRVEALKQALKEAGRTKYVNNALESSGSPPKAKAAGF
jgi:spermidine synthase